MKKSLGLARTERQSFAHSRDRRSPATTSAFQIGEPDFKWLHWSPAELVLEFECINAVAPIMTRPIRDERNQPMVQTMTRRLRAIGRVEDRCTTTRLARSLRPSIFAHPAVLDDEFERLGVIVE
jgi:hypothetical protein